METAKCPFCNNEIESDSFYCDQCGEELKICPTHGFKKGKICGECGTRLVEAKNAGGHPASPPPQPTSPSADGAPVQPQPAAPQTTSTGGSVVPPPVDAPSAVPLPVETIPVAPPVEVAPAAAAEKTVRPAPAPAEPKCLVSAALNARLDLRDGAVVGRRAGDYTHVFASQGYVSGTHARLQRNGAGQWEVVDMGSSNGTFLNGRQLAAHSPAVLRIGDTVAFYDTKFIVE